MQRAVPRVEGSSELAIYTTICVYPFDYTSNVFVYVLIGAWWDYTRAVSASFKQKTFTKARGCGKVDVAW